MGFVEWYNNIHYHSGINFTTPNSRHTGEAVKIMENRKKVYLAAKDLHPERWSKEIRNMDLMQTTPLEALTQLYELQQRLKRDA